MSHMSARLPDISMGDVPLKMPELFSPAVEEDIRITIPDYLSILQETEYEFSLEKWTLAGLQSGFTAQDSAQHSSASSGMQPSCPPYWMMFTSSQHCSLATHHFPDSGDCCHGLNPAVLSSAMFSNPDEDDIQSVTQKAKTCLSSFPASLPKRSQAVLDLSKPVQLQNPSLSYVSDVCKTSARDQTAPSMTKTPKHALLNPDSSSEVLAALSPEERELLKAITGKGYPLQTAIIALQKAGHQTSDQVFNYLVACDHLCQLGYHVAQVEEALEMFQNCETKAAEFLHLLSQFHEMGFQQNAIKEVLLIHENHRERALEELMLRLSC